MTGHICQGVTDKCENIYESYGEICVHCNACGRIDPTTMYHARAMLYSKMLAQHAEKLLDENYQTDLQQHNIRLSMSSMIEKLRHVMTKIGRD
jgi:hypothetical protein